MRICFLAHSDSSHMQKWSRYFVEHGHEVHFITFDATPIDRTFHHRIITNATSRGSDINKIRYLMHVRRVQELLKEVRPDIVNAHYASSYGTLAALACKKPYFLSVWGSDIYDFPRKTPMHRALLKYALSHADTLLSTSKAMANEASQYTNKSFFITPFGVDMNLFKPRQRVHGDNFVLAIVKTLSPKYGIDVLLKAASEVVKKRPEIPLKIRIAGSGPDELKLKRLARDLGLDMVVEWLGYISQEEAASVWADADVGVVSSSSSSESFGVAALEAQACGTPVIVADTPGLMEATVPNVSSLVFPRGDYIRLADCVISLYDNPDLRQRLAEGGLENVRKNFSYESCFGYIESLFVRSLNDSFVQI